MIRLVFLLAVMLCVAPGPLRAQDDDALRTQFRAALKQAESGVAPAAADPAELRQYRLYPYLVATRLILAARRGGDEALDAEVAAFLARHGTLPIARELRRQWLNSLAGRGQWGAFLAAYDEAATDPALRCHRFNAWIQTGGADGFQDELLETWLTGAQMPQACVAPFQWLKDQGLLTGERVEQRVRMALKAGNTELVDWLVRQVPAERAPPLQRWLRLIKEPRRELAALAAEPAQAVEAEALADGWSRLTRSKPLEALPLLEALLARPDLDARRAGELRRELALGLAWDRRAEAVAQFRLVPDSVLDERAHEWRVRAALWHGDWEQAAEWLHAMLPEQSADPRWAYFRARALEKLGRTKQSEPIYRTLAAENGYFAVLSAWRLGEKYAPQARSAPYDAERQQQLLGIEALQRARELFFLHRSDWANAEWRLAMEGVDEAGRVQAARLASSWGWHVQAVQMLAQAGMTDDLELLYPDAFAPGIERAAQWAGVPAEWVYGVMRQESTFLTTAVSSSQALGLLQLLLPTARHVAQRWQRPLPDREDLFSPEVNLPLGAAYLRDLADRFQGQFPLVMSGYNAGPNATARWLPDAPIDADIWIDNIPFTQTRAYVGKVLWHITVRRWRQTGETQDPSAMLTPVRKPSS